MLIIFLLLFNLDNFKLQYYNTVQFHKLIILFFNIWKQCDIYIIKTWLVSLLPNCCKLALSFSIFHPKPVRPMGLLGFDPVKPLSSVKGVFNSTPPHPATLHSPWDGLTIRVIVLEMSIVNPIFKPEKSLKSCAVKAGNWLFPSQLLLLTWRVCSIS